MTSAEQTVFHTETNQTLKSHYKNRFKFWEVIGDADSNIVLALYHHQDTEDSDCIPVEVNAFPEHQTAKLLYEGTTLLQGNFIILNALSFSPKILVKFLVWSKLCQVDF